jgi:hypothetical protein
MAGLTFVVLAVVALGLVVVALGLALERVMRRDQVKPPPQLYAHRASPDRPGRTRHPSWRGQRGPAPPNQYLRG